MTNPSTPPPGGEVYLRICRRPNTTNEYFTPIRLVLIGNHRICVGDFMRNFGSINTLNLMYNACILYVQIQLTSGYISHRFPPSWISTLCTDDQIIRWNIYVHVPAGEIYFLILMLALKLAMLTMLYSLFICF